IYSTHHVLNTDPRGTSLFTLLLHDALPISCPEAKSIAPRARLPQKPTTRSACVGAAPPPRKAGAAYAETKNIIPRARLPPSQARSEEHTSELQSRENLVCRLLLEKKKRAWQ